MSDTIISVEGLGKKYVLSHQGGERGGYRRFSESLEGWIKKPFQLFAGDRRKKIGPLGPAPAHPGESLRDDGKGRSRDGIADRESTVPLSPNSHLLSTSAQEEFWALKDVSFEVKRGEVVGIIGRNGAGKSTLLKILSRITEPTEGRVTLRGRVASLLEVGTGFHPELTGRENIYLNGAILGMTKAEIRKKFDEIVAFAEVERFLDTPVKRYSSGMYVRLAFAVAAHLEPEILVVDEVLAVGDAEFQKKCLGKMKDVATGGRTVLFVSHNMGAVSHLCQKGLLMQKGILIRQGPVEDVISAYAASPMTSELPKNRGPLQDYLQLIASEVTDREGGTVLEKETDLVFRLTYRVKQAIRGFVPLVGVEAMGSRIFTLNAGAHDLAEGQTVSFDFILKKHMIRPGYFQLAGGGVRGVGEWLWCDTINQFEILGVYEEQKDRACDGFVYWRPGEVEIIQKIVSKD